ncbi:hypothetical protein BJ741DRAFT_602251 [Chytriomyces cf. hyalinus JEL632]|nr:hypothetical protein BJ741DRAFT_602251 [Chytriomyces cf. hyalinus JEL632]
MSSTTASSKGGPMLGGTSESADALLNEFLFDTQPLPVIQLDQAPLSAFDEDPQFALFAASNARNRRASLPSELLSGLDGLSFGGDYGMDAMDPLMMDPAMLELLGNGGGGAMDQGTVDPFDIYNTNPFNYNTSALSAGLSASGSNNSNISNAANHSAGSKPIPIPSNAHINSLKPPSSSYSDRTLSTSAPQTGSDFFTLFAKSFKTPPMALSTSFVNNNLVIPSPEASPIAGRRSSFSNPSGTSPMLNRRPSLSNPNASGGPLGNRRGSLSNPSSGNQDAQHHMLHHPLQQQQQIESSILHKPRFSKFKSPSSPTLATFANQSLFAAPTVSATSAAVASSNGIAVAATATTTPIMQNMDTRPRDHVCSMCGNKFLRRQDLMRHEVTHSTVKQFTCLYGCGASFGRSDALGRHMKNGKCRAVGQQ